MSESYKNIFLNTTAFIFIVLFVYTVSDKLINLQEFREFLSRLELIGFMGGVLAVLIPIFELLISLLLLVPSLRRLGMLASCVLMSLFTLYLIYMRFTAAELPCHCGGAISTLSWTQHIWLNLMLILLSALVVFINRGFSNRRTKAGAG